MLHKLLFILTVCACLPQFTYAVEPVKFIAQDKTDTLGLIPKPQSLELSKGSLTLKNKMTFSFPKALSKEAQLLSGYLKNDLKISLKKTKPSKADIILKIDKSIKHDEAYKLNVSSAAVSIKAKSAQGIFYGIQTLRQLLPTKGEYAKVYRLPLLKIADQPRFQWRGFMLDSCRHMQSIEFIKKYIDHIASYKMNIFHWHLTEDEAWRMEIKKYPKLTEIGSKPGKEGQELNGFYTQEEMKEIVRYANKRHIKVIPEFDIPGHVNALLVSYPEYLCNDEKSLTIGPPSMRAFSKDGRRALCAGKAKTLPFVMDIYKEMQEIFTDGIIHIGGDERPKGVWEKCKYCTAKQKKLGLKTASDLQNWFLNEVSEGLRKRKVRSMAWDEHIEGGVPKEQIVHAWQNTKALDAVKLGHSVVNSVNGFFYLDYPAHGKELNQYAGWMRGLRLPTKKIYNYEPVPAHFTPAEKARIIGVESPLWTETVKMDRVDKMVFPRILATAESAWTSKANKSWPSFQQRFAVHRSVLDSKDIQYDKQDIIVTEPIVAQWTAQTTPAQFTKLKFDVSKYIKKEGSYEFKVEYQSGRHALRIESLSLNQAGKQIAVDKHSGITGGASRNNVYTCLIKKMSEKPVYLEMIVKGEGGTDSSGKVTLVK